MDKILIIEDDQLVSRMYEKVFTNESFSIQVANNGQEGIEKAKSFTPDLIFCDVMMPKMNGLEVLDALKKDADLKNIPIVMLTNLSGTHDAETALGKGALAYLVKSEHKPKDVVTKAREFLANIAGPQAATIPGLKTAPFTNVTIPAVKPEPVAAAPAAPTPTPAKTTTATPAVVAKPIPAAPPAPTKQITTHLPAATPTKPPPSTTKPVVTTEEL
jgi:CheY-like chemotaxis protein